MSNTQYNTASQPTSMTLGSTDSDSFTFDPSTDRLTQFKFTVNSQSLTGTVGWNALGTPSSLDITDAFNSADTQNCSFAHDDLTRLATANCGTIWGQSFTYDAFGNITKTVLSGSSGTSFQPTYAVPSTNRIASLPSFTPTYDLNGNLTKDPQHQYGWNSNGRPVTIDSLTLTYDALDRMVEQNNAGAYQQIVYDPLGEKFALMNGQTLKKAFAPLPDGGIAAYTSTGLAYYRHPDWLGSSRLASTPTRTIYSDTAYAPFGEPYAQSGTADPSFTGQNQDTASNLYDFLYREDSPIQGRWISPDPAGLAAVSLTDPQSWNRYAYVRNSPLLFADSLGLTCFKVVINDDGSEGIDPDTVLPFNNQGDCTAGGGVWITNTTTITVDGNDPSGGAPDGCVTLLVDGIDQGTVCNQAGGNGSSSNGGGSANGVQTPISCNPTTGICVPSSMMKPRPAGCGAAIAQGAISFGLDVVGAIPGFGNAVSATAAGARAVNGIVAYGGAAYGTATGLTDESPIGVAGAGAGLGLTLADATLQGGKVIPVLGNALSATIGLYDGYQLAKSIGRCR